MPFSEVNTSAYTYTVGGSTIGPSNTTEKAYVFQVNANATGSRLSGVLIGLRQLVANVSLIFELHNASIAGTGAYGFPQYTVDDSVLANYTTPPFTNTTAIVYSFMLPNEPGWVLGQGTYAFGVQ